MRLLSVVLFLFVCYFGVRSTEVEATQWYNITNEEDMELEKQLNLLNKPAVKSIKTKHGDLYDCIDFYKQPAFDHPLLKDYKFDYKMKPTLSQPNTNNQILDKSRKPANFRLKGGGCPAGTVPIRRITKEDLIREKYISTIKPLADDNKPGAHYAVIRTKRNGKKYNGAGGKITIHNPPCIDKQYSAAKIKIQNGPDSIEAGWRVDPALYGDKLTRLFIRLDAGQAHCFNTRCPGFIIINTDIPLDLVLDQVSEPGGDFISSQFYLNRDLINGNWWFQIGNDYEEVGFWPARIFTGLSDWATSAEWGGEVFSPPGTKKPPMGAGHPLGKIFLGILVDANIYQCSLLDGNRTLNADKVETFADSKTYRVKDLGTFHDDYKHIVIYGGPSGY